MEIGKYIEEGLIAFFPVYLEMRGNCTLIYTLNGEEKYIERSTKTFLNCLGKYYLIDLKESKKYYGELLGINNLVPIPFNREDIFIPVKTRKPISKNDGALGYVNISYIEKLKEIDGQCIIYLSNNFKIKSLNSLKTIDKHIKQGEIVRKLYIERQNFSYEVYDFYSEYDEPATKGDIAILRQELLRIKETLR